MTGVERSDGARIAFWIGAGLHVLLVLATLGVWLLFAALAGLCVWVCGKIAQQRGRDPWIGYANGCLLGPFGIATCLVLDRRDR